MKNRIKTGQFDFPSPEWNNVSNDAKTLISSMLSVDPSVRLTINEVVKHKWIAVSELKFLTVFCIKYIIFCIYFNRVFYVFLGVRRSTANTFVYWQNAERVRGRVARSTRRNDPVSGHNAS